MITAIVVAAGLFALAFMLIDEYTRSEVTMLILLFIVIVVLVVGVMERAFLIATTIAIWLAITHFIGPLLTYIKTHPWQTVLYIVGYFLIGAVWSIGKWWFAETDRVSEAKEQFAARQHSETWIEYAAKQKSNPTRYKEDIIIWIAFWPINVLWTTFHDMIRRVCKRIYRELLRIYQAITDHVWK